MASYTRRTNFTANHAMLVTTVLLAMTMSSWINDVEGANNASVVLPPILSACLTPLSPSSSSRWDMELSSGKTLKNVSNFCNEAGLVCHENIKTPSATLHSFSRFKVENTEKASLEYENLFFTENELSGGRFIKLPIQEPYLPTRAFLPPLLQPHLFNPPTSVLSHVLLLFGFQTRSPLAKSMQHTLQICNAPPLQNETKACVATLEAMLEFATSLIGTSDVAVLTGAILPPQQIVKIMDLEEMTCAGERVAISCHNAMFPFQVFYCHHIKGTKVFKVTLQTTLNRMVNISAVASCHPSDAYLRASRHIKLQQGELLCHWNYGDNIVWIPSKSKLLFPSRGKFLGLSLSN